MHYDLIIIGGGMVGASLACALRDTSLRVALIDAAPLTNPEDPRLIALNYGSHCLFKNIGIWQDLALYATAIEQIHVSEQGRFGSTRLIAHEVGLNALGYMVPAKYINAALSNTLTNPTVADEKKINPITIFRPARLINLSQTATNVALTIEDSTIKTLTGKIVIGADGSDSTVRQLLGIKTDTLDYQQSAIVTITTLQRHHKHIAYERFHQGGAIAFLPLANQQCATIWTDNNATITTLMQLSDDEFLQTLQKRFGYRLGRLQKINKRYVFPLQFIRAHEQIKQQVMLIGNAAHTLHPIAAQGLNLALHEVACIAQIIMQQLNTQQPICLAALHTQIIPQQQSSMRLTQRLTWLFSSNFFIANFARQLGIIGLNILPFAKQRFIRKAIGRAGNTPNLFLEKYTHEFEQ